MVREIFDRLLAAIVAYVVGLGQTAASGFLIAGLAMVGITAFFVTVFGVVAVYALAGSPPGLAAVAGVIGFGGGMVVASIVVIKLVRWGARHLPADDSASQALASGETPATPARADVMASVAALDRHLAPPADDAAPSQVDEDDTART